MKTYEDVMTAHAVEIPAHLVAQAEIPILSGPQRQGDVLVVPTRAGQQAGDPIPPAGVAVVRGEAGGNTHLLVGAGLWAPAQSGDPRELGLGTLTVRDGETAFLLHPEHGAQGFAPGTYRVVRQREQAEEIRRVAD